MSAFFESDKCTWLPYRYGEHRSLARFTRYPVIVEACPGDGLIAIRPTAVIANAPANIRRLPDSWRFPMSYCATLLCVYVHNTYVIQTNIIQYSERSLHYCLIITLNSANTYSMNNSNEATLTKNSIAEIYIY